MKDQWQTFLSAGWEEGRDTYVQMGARMLSRAKWENSTSFIYLLGIGPSFGLRAICGGRKGGTRWARPGRQVDGEADVSTAHWLRCAPAHRLDRGGMHTPLQQPSVLFFHLASIPAFRKASLCFIFGNIPFPLPPHGAHRTQVWKVCIF